MASENKISRRNALIAVAGATTSAATIFTSTQAHAKVAQKAVKYQNTPKGDQACENCSLFEAPSSCKTVDGTVSPQGWCMVYAKKPA